MKKISLILILLLAPLAIMAQSPFDSFENDKDVSSVVVTKNMFKLLSKMDLDSSDPEAKEYLDMVDNLDDIKIYTTDNPTVMDKMSSTVSSYIKSNSSLSELMRMKSDGQDVRFYSKEGKNENFVSELLMFVNGNNDGTPMTVVMSISGNIDLKQIGKLAEQLNVPGSEELKNINKKN